MRYSNSYNILFFIIILEVTIIAGLSLVYAMLLTQRLMDLRILAIKNCIYLNGLHNKTVCLV